ncbi:hypothetical protein BRARA_D00501 [Brassica rapa]|uniref:PI31 proteasome regulator N-terminal domain-containing protein n=1 Tax=Brassica campestris TaxID=3711 RepID=A0A397ZIQ4_BRACM|nr:hypothetical protein BRARA_D00501 [Brassica rapa]
MENSQIVMLVIKSTRPRFRNNHDKVAFVVHATFVVSGYKLVAIGRHALATLSLPLLLEVGIEGRNESDKYAFVYCLAIGDKLLVDAIAVGGTYPTAHLEIKWITWVSKRTGPKLQNQILNKLDEGLKPIAYTTRNSSKRNREPEPVHYARRPFPLGPQFQQPSG